MNVGKAELTNIGPKGPTKRPAPAGKPTLLAWSYNDPTATIDQGYALFDLISRNTHDSRMYIFNRAGHFSYREHPAEFNEMLRSFIERNV